MMMMICLHVYLPTCLPTWWSSIESKWIKSPRLKISIIYKGTTTSFLLLLLLMIRWMISRGQKNDIREEMDRLGLTWWWWLTTFILSECDCINGDTTPISLLLSIWLNKSAASTGCIIMIVIVQRSNAGRRRSTAWRCWQCLLDLILEAGHIFAIDPLSACCHRMEERQGGRETLERFLIQRLSERFFPTDAWIYLSFVEGWKDGGAFFLY